MYLLLVGHLFPVAFCLWSINLMAKMSTAEKILDCYSILGNLCNQYGHVNHVLDFLKGKKNLSAYIANNMEDILNVLIPQM